MYMYTYIHIYIYIYFIYIYIYIYMSIYIYIYVYIYIYICIYCTCRMYRTFINPRILCYNQEERDEIFPGSCGSFPVAPWRRFAPRPLRHRDDGEGKSLALWTQMDTGGAVQGGAPVR